MSETKAAFAERAIQSLKKILYRYMEDNGYKYIHKLTQFVTTLNSRRNCSIDLISKNLKNYNSILYSKPLRDFLKPKFKIGDRVSISRYVLSSRRIIRHSLHKKFSNFLQFLPENLLQTQYWMKKVRLSAVNFIKNSLSKSFNNAIVHNRVSSKCICPTISRQNTELFNEFFARATESGKSMGSCNFRNILRINVTKCYQNLCFLTKKLSKPSELYYVEHRLYPSIADIVEAMNTLIQERHNNSENYITVKVSRRTQKVEIYLANEGSGFTYFSTDLRHIFRSNVGNDFRVMLRGALQTGSCLRHCPHTLSHDIHGPD